MKKCEVRGANEEVRMNFILTSNLAPRTSGFTRYFMYDATSAAKSSFFFSMPSPSL